MSRAPVSSRLDKALVERGLARSREDAERLISLGKVRVNGALADKAARQVKRADAILVASEGASYVGRGAYKLLGALDELGIDVSGLEVCDLGSSTGGFTQVLLERGAASVLAVDVGRQQMSERVSADRRVRLLEGVNARHLRRDEVGLGQLDLVVGDLSFISLTLLADVVAHELLQEHGAFLLLVKPQFEVDRKVASKGRGVVRDPGEWSRALEAVIGAFTRRGARIEGVVPSRTRGASGNQEFFVFGRFGASAAGAYEDDVAPLVAAAVGRAATGLL
ncbi:MAG: TlyA family RNA methyltransferase [Actinomycetota bacterium]|nr:TlyA family RNA methyltransferase [Actinomycetota bacterium]